jgi:nucleoside-diphosphate-sugar epimerase
MQRLPQRDLEHVLEHTRELWEDLRGASVFLTGGTGFVGTWVLESLLAANAALDLRARVVVLTRSPERVVNRYPHLARDRSVELLGGDVRRFDAPEGTFPFVIHAATEASIAANAEQPLGAFDADVEGTRHVLEFARTHGVRRFLFTSSGAVYGQQPPELTHIPEEYSGAPSTMDAGSAYGQAKRVSEFMSVMYGRVHGFDAMIARLFAFVGPLLPLDANYAVGNFIRDALRGGPVRVSGDGTPYRSYLYAADLAIWLWTILLRGTAAHPYNVGSASDLTIAELARTVVAETAPQTRIEVARQAVAGTPPLRYVPRATRAKEQLSLSPKIPLEEGVRRTFEWHRAGDGR